MQYKPKTIRTIVRQFDRTAVVNRQYGSHCVWDVYEWHLYNGQWTKIPGQTGHIDQDAAIQYAERRDKKIQKMLDTNKDPPGPLKIETQDRVIDA